jgi:hypothetical protein
LDHFFTDFVTSRRVDPAGSLHRDNRGIVRDYRPTRHYRMPTARCNRGPHRQEMCGRPFVVAQTFISG